jgi:glutamate/tyrosine decarboxylase-like PLP-dependent enzyme
VLRYSVRTAHPQFLNQLYGGFDTAGFVGDLVTSLLNTSMYTYEVAPLGTLMELELIGKMNARVGFGDGEGIFCTGGSHANLIGVLCARDRALPEGRHRGIAGNEPLELFVSDQAHYSFLKAAVVLGIGMEHVILVRSDERGRMIPDELDAAIRSARRRGARPFCVGATAGTTVLGAIDPLQEIAAICRDHDVWMHVDGAWGGPILLSERHRRLLHGAERADSFAWDAHKLMGSTLTCSAILTRRKGVLLRTCGTDAQQTEYLFHETDDSALDLGRMSLQCGRRTDALRLWLMWKHHGDRGLARSVDHLFELSRYAAERVERHPHLELMAPLQSLNLCFRFRPDGDADLNALNLRLRERLRKQGRSFFNFSHLGDRLALRIAFTNPTLTEADVDRLLDHVTGAGDEV